MKKLYLSFFLILALLGWTNAAFAQVTFGNRQGSVTLVEYFDYNCPICRGYFPVIDYLAHINFNLRVIQRVVPALAPSSVFVDRAVIASFLQHKFNIFEHAILTVHNPETIPAGQVLEIAKSVGLNISKLKKDMASKIVTDQLRQNIRFFLALHQNHIPVIQIYKTNNPKHFSVFTGAIPPQELQRVINNLGGRSNEER